jgi:hypothetical protein
MKPQKPHIVPKYVTYGFFLVGLFSAIAFRVIIVLQRMEPDWVRPVWYLGVAGYMFFFFYRYGITKKRKNAITNYALIEKVESKTLSEEDRQVLLYLLSSIKVSLEDINYALIFFLSIVAIVADIILGVLK